MCILDHVRSFLGWFVDDATSNDIDSEVFSEALAAAINLTDKFTWPRDHLTFQSVYENVSVSVSTLPFEMRLLSFKDANIYTGFHQSKSFFF